MKNLFKKLFDTKFKKISWFVAIITIILCLGFIRIVPNYSKKYDFEIVSLWDYNKYNRGYCLVENRILDKEELYKRAVVEYLKKELEIENKLDEYRIKTLGKNKRANSIDIGYYKFDDDINLNNWIYKLKEAYDNRDIYADSVAGDLILNILKATQIDPNQYISVNLKEMTAGFARPIFFSEYFGRNRVLLDNFILLCEDDTIDIFNGYSLFGYIGDKFKDKNIIGNELKKYKYKQKCNLKYSKKIDNCGHLDYGDMEKIFLEQKEYLFG
ncbi:hypothetical protein OFO10_06995 [Campylobacter sp. VBCF_06 NA8]|uniref:hypothetical protein n=1 Tax=Campylobacter sp. VBCF_06 NA8 TaxID=2983822 RepID=UPI0022EA00D9|nr:hypothetical protein [Campylobacter sp. VBCF_06 NA8]MDA3046902.1 hypothetical protein [Campylobacter sp. VBCF_06 NA8]